MLDVRNLPVTFQNTKTPQQITRRDKTQITCFIRTLSVLQENEYTKD